MRPDKVTFLDLIIFIGGLYWVFTTESSKTFWTISISLLLIFLAKSYLIYSSNIKKKKTDEEEVLISDSNKDLNSKFCPSCLKQIIVLGNFCTNCGNKLI
jgi:hypothetical protein